MKKFFILEDDHNRISVLRRALNTMLDEYDFYHAISVDKAIELFPLHYPYDSIFLGHDLGNKTMIDSNQSNTGYQFVKWLKENYISIDNDQVFIHSMNPDGATRMGEVLKKAVVLPFPILIQAIKGE